MVKVKKVGVPSKKVEEPVQEVKRGRGRPPKQQTVATPVPMKAKASRESAVKPAPKPAKPAQKEPETFRDIFPYRFEFGDKEFVVVEDDSKENISKLAKEKRLVALVDESGEELTTTIVLWYRGKKMILLDRMNEKEDFLAGTYSKGKFKDNAGDNYDTAFYTME